MTQYTQLTNLFTNLIFRAMIKMLLTGNKIATAELWLVSFVSSELHWAEQNLRATLTVHGPGDVASGSPCSATLELSRATDGPPPPATAARACCASAGLR